ncbi:hypothetical protein LCGC14_0332160 [marine sediment metagenome]|uniref:Uncharacterized protein n=1 Tax=marine sediment metagenome TaxID=412755 RepID=A0A0F9TZ16_9ZZZZ
MSQGFVFGTPANRSDLESVKVRVNLDALGTANAGDTAPAAPKEGMFWLDTSNAPTQWLLKQFLGGAFQILISFPTPTNTATITLFTITPAVVTWTLTHNFNRAAVSVSLFDTNGKSVEALDVNVSNVNEAVITHAFALGGTAVVIG